MKIFAYIRYSSSNQTGNCSVEMQREAIVRLVATQTDLRGKDIVERRDEAKTGTTLKHRDGLASIIRDAKKGDAVVVFKYDRLGRNLLESLQTIKQLEERGVGVYSTSEPNSEIVRNLLLSMAQEFSKQLGDRCQRALRALAASGSAANRAPYGYAIKRETPKGRGKYEPVPEQAAIVRRIYEMRAAGQSHREIAFILNSERIPSAMRRGWNATTVLTILRNETYRGRVISGMRIFKKGLGYQGRRARSEWTCSELGVHPAIISEELWSAVRNRDSSQPTGHRKRPASHSHHLWSGFLRCPVCNSSLVRQMSRSVAYYGCDHSRQTGIHSPCQNRCLVREDEITATVAQMIRQQLSSAWIEVTVKIIQEEIQARLGSAESLLRPLEATTKRLDTQIESAERRLVHVPEDSMPMFLDELSKLKEDREAIRQKARLIKSQADSAFDASKLEREIRTKVDHLLTSLEGTDVLAARDELRKEVERIEIAPDRSALLHPRPDGLLAGLSEAGGASLYPRRDSNPRPPV